MTPPADPTSDGCWVVALDDTGDVLAIDPSGGRTVALTRDASDQRLHLQPTPSPDGQRVAWCTVDRDPDGELAAHLVVARCDGDEPVTSALAVPLTFPAFYLAWRPDGRAVAHLANGPLGLELTVTDLDHGADTIVSRGAPLFFDWSCDGALCVHVGPHPDDDLRLAAPALLGHDRPLGPLPATFTAPAWLPDGRSLVAAVLDAAGRPWLALVDRDGDARPLAPVDGSTRFALDPTGTAVAHVSADALAVLDLATGAEVDVLDHPPVAFEWSPDGRHLLVCDVREEAGSARLWWRVWSGGQFDDHASFRPTAHTARQELPFAEQYTRSRSWWLPDSTGYVWAGVDPATGRAGIWLRRLREDRPEFLATGCTVSAPRRRSPVLS